MASKPSTTLLLVTRDSLTRADFRGGAKPALVGFWRQARPAVDDAGLLIEAALALGPRHGRVVWVLHAELWTQTVALPARQVVSMAPPDLSTALAHEIEPFSGLSPFESVLAQVEAGREGTQQAYWVCQARSAELADIDEAIHRTGSRLGGLLHPGGLGRPLTLPAEETWQRIELWPDAVVLLHGEPGKPVRRTVINADPAHGRWQGDVEAWRKKLESECPWETRLIGGEVATFAADGTPIGTLDEQEALAIWLTAWAAELAGRRQRAPALQPAARPIGAGARRLIGALLLTLAVAASSAHHLLVSKELTTMNAELTDVQTRISRGDALKGEKRRLENEKANLAREIAPLEAKVRECESGLLAHARRQARLMNLLAQFCPDELVIQKIEADAAGLMIHGEALTPEAINGYAAALDRAVRPLNWRVAPPTQKARHYEITGTTTLEFDIALQEIVPQLSAPQPQTPVN